MKLWESILNLFFPLKCPFCGRIVEEPAPCARCRKELPWVESGGVLRRLPGGAECVSPLYYEGRVRDCLLRMKFHDYPAAAEPLGRLIAQCAAEELSGRFDVVTWTPVGPKRLKKRGYDQARLLAESACRCWETAPERLLTKRRDNPAQSSLESADARKRNVKNVYSPAPGARIAGRRVLLVDDIVTTGATLSECARILQENGAADVVCAAAATPRRMEGSLPEEKISN